MINIIFIWLLAIFIILLGIFFCFKGFSLIQEAKQIQITKDSELEKQKQEKIRIQKENEELSNKRTNLLLAIEKEKEKYDNITENEKNKLSKQLKIYKENINHAREQYLQTLEDNYMNAENEHDDLLKQYKDEMKNAEAQLKDLQSSLTAGVQAQLREREKEENLQFYKLSVSPIDLEDIIKLNTLKMALHNPVILSKLIWTQYFQKQTTEMCNRILGTDKKCGIYKITNLKTQQCYIGQSVDVAQRWKDHVKCGLGIDASATNKLYNAMQNEGVWNFSFELIEECPRTDLDKKEKQWIEMYQSNIYSYNTTKGNH